MFGPCSSIYQEVIQRPVLHKHGIACKLTLPPGILHSMCMDTPASAVGNVNAHSVLGFVRLWASTGCIFTSQTCCGFSSWGCKQMLLSVLKWASFQCVITCLSRGGFDASPSNQSLSSCCALNELASTVLHWITSKCMACTQPCTGACNSSVLFDVACRYSYTWSNGGSKIHRQSVCLMHLHLVGTLLIDEEFVDWLIIQEAWWLLYQIAQFLGLLLYPFQQASMLTCWRFLEMCFVRLALVTELACQACWQLSWTSLASWPAGSSWRKVSFKKRREILYTFAGHWCIAIQFQFNILKCEECCF